MKRLVVFTGLEMNMKKHSIMPLVAAIYCVLVSAAFADPGAAFYDIQDQTCSEFAIFGQDPSVDSASVEFLSSNINTGFLIYDNFTGVTGTIQQVSWWGTTGYNSLEGMLLSDCLPSTFWIVFRNYDPSWPDFPGNIEAVYKVTASVEETGQVYSDFYQRKYKATINPPLNLSDGWISIVGNAEIEEECWFMWQDAGEGNSVVFETDGGYWNQMPYDHAFCLESVADQPGVCCYVSGITTNCTPAADQSECDQYPGGTFHPGATCDDDDGNDIADICEQMQEEGACCYLDGYQTKCLVIDMEQCEEIYLGDFYTSETCADDNGNETADICEPPPVSGACCYWAGPFNMCVETQDEEECSQYSSSTFYPNETCVDDDGNEIADICEGGSLSGACCYWAGPFNMCVETQDEEECSQYSSSTFYPGETCVDDDGNEIADICEEPDTYEYLPGDANMINGQWPPKVIGADVTYLVGYFRGINGQCLVGGFYNSGDANGDCNIIGSDVTRLVSYFRGLSEIAHCADYPPAWLVPDDCPTEAPDGWPNCEVVPGDE
jgi:hypothetical protein